MSHIATTRGTGQLPPRVVSTTVGKLAVIGLASACVMLEVITHATSTSIFVGWVGLSLSTLPAVALLIILGPRPRQHRTEVERLIPFWVAMTAGIALGWYLFNRHGDVDSFIGLSAAAIDEEVVYRFALPLVLALALSSLRIPLRIARFSGYLIAGVFWVLLPGHQAQITSPVKLISFAAFAVISATILARSRALIPMSVAHFAMNLITVSALRGDLSDPTRGALVAGILLLSVGTFVLPETAKKVGAGAPSDGDLLSDTVIDLRDGVRPSVTVGTERLYLDQTGSEEEIEKISVGSGQD